MPSFLIRGLARYTAASIMEHNARNSYNNNTPTPEEKGNQLSNANLRRWKTDMRWLIPFVQATGYRIVIENPKSHEQIVIDQNTKELPPLTLKWMQKYNKQELLEWMTQKKEKEEARRIKEAHGRSRFGDSFIIEE